MENQQKEYGSIEESARLSALIEALSLSQKKLAESIGVSRSLINLVVKAQRDLTEDIVYRIARKYENVNPAWLLTGEGEMLKKEIAIESDPEKAEMRREIERLKEELRNKVEALEKSEDRGFKYLELLRDALKQKPDA